MINCARTKLVSRPHSLSETDFPGPLLDGGEHDVCQPNFAKQKNAYQSGVNEQLDQKGYEPDPSQTICLNEDPNSIGIFRMGTRQYLFGLFPDGFHVCIVIDSNEHQNQLSYTMQMVASQRKRDKYRFRNLIRLNPAQSSNYLVCMRVDINFFSQRIYRSCPKSSFKMSLPITQTFLISTTSVSLIRRPPESCAD